MGKYVAYVGTYTHGTSHGIYVYDIDKHNIYIPNGFGNLKENYLKEATNEYIKRISKFLVEKNTLELL